MLISSLTVVLGVFIRLYMGIMKVYNTLLLNCISSVNMLFSTNCGSTTQFARIHGRKTILHDGQDALYLALAGCGTDEVTVCGEFCRREKNRYLQQLQFVGHRLWGSSPEHIGRNLGGIIVRTYVDQNCFAHVGISECY